MTAGPAEIVLEEIITCSCRKQDPAGRLVTVINESDAQKIAGKYSRSLNSIYKASLTAGIWPYRYVRNQDTLTLKEQLSLAESRVALIGCGGLGGYVLMILARIGIGSLVIVDPDSFDESNLNRQAFAVSDTIGMPKTVAASRGIQLINPAVEVKEFQMKINPSNAGQLLDGVNIVVDALDNLPDRRMLKQMTYQMKLPLVHGAIAGFEGQVMTFLTEGDGSIGLFENGEEKEIHRDMNAESLMGVPSITPVFIASLQAMEVVKILLKRGKVISGRMLYSDIEVGDFNYFDFKT